MRPTAALFGVVVVAFLVHAGTLGSGFVYDDLSLVVNNPQIGDPAWVPDLFRKGWRPLKRLSLMLDFALWGRQPAGFHLTNLLWHSAAVAAVWWLTRALGASVRLATWAALLFAAHPIVTESVAVITHRKEMMATTFVAIALALHLRRPPGLVTTIAVVLATALALLSKEVAGAAFPLLLIGVEICRQRPDPRRRRQALTLIGLAALAALALFAIRAPHIDPFGPELAGAAAISHGVIADPGGHIASVARAFADSASLAVWPVSLCVDHPFQPSAHFTVGAVGAVILLLAVPALGLWLRRRWPLLGLGLLWLPLSWLPVSNLVPLTPWFVAERFLYLPAFGLCLAAAAAFDRLAMRPGWTRPSWAVVLGLVALMGWRSHVRERVFADEETLFRATLACNPESFIAHRALAGEFHRQGRLAEAVPHYRAVLAVANRNRMALTNLCDALVRLGEIRAGLSECATAARHLPDDAAVHLNYGNALQAIGDPAAADSYRRAIELEPELAQAHLQLGVVLGKRGEHTAAEASLHRAADLAPELKPAQYYLAIAALQRGQPSEARQRLLRLLDRDDLSDDERTEAQRLLTASGP